MEEQEIIIKTTLAGVYKIMRPTFADERGFFHEIFRKHELEKAIGHGFNIVQANHSRSIRGALRGIHRASWNKLVTATSGKVQQIVVDLRENSPTFGHYESFVLGEEGPEYSVFVPAGCGNAFLTLSEEANYVYMVDDYWEEGKEIGILATDPDLQIRWFFDKLNLSAKDQKNQTVRELFPSQFIA